MTDHDWQKTDVPGGTENTRWKRWYCPRCSVSLPRTVNGGGFDSNPRVVDNPSLRPGTVESCDAIILRKVHDS